MRLNQITAPARDLQASIGFYELLGLTLIVENDHYARFELPDGEATFSLHLTPDVAHDNAPILYFETEDLDMEVRRLQRAGVQFQLEPTDQSWLWREAHLRDPAGNALILYRAGEARRNPPWRIKDDPNLYTLVLCEDAFHLLKTPELLEDRDLTPRFPRYTTSFSQRRFADVFDLIRWEWPDLFVRSRAALKAFAASNETELRF